MGENADIIRRLIDEGMNGSNEAVMDELLAPDFVNYDMPMPAPGPEGMKAVVGMFRTGFPDMRVTAEDVLEDGDRVATRGHFTGTHDGEFMGMPATGRPIDVKYMDMWRIRDGKAAENWVQVDMAGLMQQLGAS